MQYLILYCTVFLVIGLRAFQQKVVAANRYPVMGFIGTLIYIGEGSAVLMIAKGGTLLYVSAGALGAGTGCVTFVYLYNRFFNKPRSKS